MSLPYVRNTSLRSGSQFCTGGRILTLLVDDDILEYIADLEERVKRYEKKINDKEEMSNKTEKDVEKREGYEKILIKVLIRLEKAENDYANLPE